MFKKAFEQIQNSLKVETTFRKAVEQFQNSIKNEMHILQRVSQGKQIFVVLAIRVVHYELYLK